MSEEQPFINPIDPAKITTSPGLLPYAHHAGSLPIQPVDEGKTKSKALRAMEFQTEAQLHQIYEQIQLLAEQAKRIEERKKISLLIYQCNLKFEPLIHHVYHLYQKNEEYLISLIGPQDWGKSKNDLRFIATVRLLSDHTWEIMDKAKDPDFFDRA